MSDDIKIGEGAPVVQPVQPVVEPVAPVVEPVPAAPVAEPVQPVVAPVSEPVIEPVTEPVAVPKYEPTGNEFFDAASEILHDGGFDAKVIADEAASENGMSDETRAKLTEKLGPAQVKMLEAGLAKEKSKAVTTAEQVVHTEAGSKEMWDAIVQWTTTEGCGLTPEGEAEYNAMLAKGGVQATLAVKALKEAYMASPGFKEVTIVDGDTTPPVQSGVEPISRTVYTTEKRNAVRAGDGVLVEQLEARARYTMEHHPQAWRTFQGSF